MILYNKVGGFVGQSQQGIGMVPHQVINWKNSLNLSLYNRGENQNFGKISTVT